MHILLVKIGAAGDVLRTTALLPGLKQKYPGAQIDWLTEEAHQDILLGNPYLAAVFSVEALPPSFHKKRYDLILNLDEEPDVCHLISRLKKKKIIGTYLKDGVVIYTPESAVRFDMSRISLLGMTRADQLKKKNRRTYQEICYDMLNMPFQGQRPHLTINPRDRLFAAQFSQTHNISENDEVIGINTGAGLRWPNKRLSIIETARLITLVHKKKPKAKLLLLGGPNEAARNSEIHSRTPRIINPGCHHPVKRFAALVDLCSTLVTSDSFSLHIGTALGKRIIAFFGPTSPWEIELYGNGEKILPIRGCVGCFKPRCTIPLKFDIHTIANAI